MELISKEEQQRRRQMSASVFGTHAMENIVPDAATVEIFWRHDSGELPMEEFSTAMDAHAARLLAESRTFAGAA